MFMFIFILVFGLLFLGLESALGGFQYAVGAIFFGLLFLGVIRVFNWLLSKLL